MRKSNSLKQIFIVLATTAISVTIASANNLNYTIVSFPEYGTLNGALPNLVYTPNIGYDGPDSFTFKVDDGAEESDVATVSITVNNVVASLSVVGGETGGSITNGMLNLASENIPMGAGVTNYLQFKEDLSSGSWSNLQVFSDVSTTNWTVTLPSTQGFYRIKTTH